MASDQRAANNKLAPQLNLALLRERKKISLRDIEDETKISIRFLKAIEDEEFNQLPGGIFSTSYIRQYAAIVGHDETELIEHYRTKMGLNEPEESQGPGRRGKRQQEKVSRAFAFPPFS